ncbi:MAG: hypothetical protein A4S09_06685 [Proteobacteria bacterium SG_bin7]|nr:MAG: hypothetical protein A4S09_06685 [Proteobacteria bacterium SG_bin7]
MTLKSSCLSLIVLGCVGCTSGGNIYRLIVDHEVCGKDQKNMQKLSDAEAKEFFKIIAPFADLDRAVQIAPQKDNDKITPPAVQKKVITDLREKCLLNAKETESLGKDFENQTFKYKRKTVEKDTTKAGVTCPIAVIEEVTPLQTAPALVEVNTIESEDKNVTRSVKAEATVIWQKQDPTYKLLGAFSSMTLKGTAETLWYKKLPIEEAEPKFQNVVLYVREKYNLSLNLDENKKYEGHYSTCRKFQDDIDPNNIKPKTHYEAIVTRIGLKIDKDKMNEAKFITTLKYSFNEETKQWVLERSTRNDFYLNNVLLSTDEVAVLEKNRQDSIEFTISK